jgi:phage terminase small subunit
MMADKQEQPTQSAYEGLSNKQRAFVDAYCSNGFNATRAAATAKYADANSQSARLLVNVGIATAIKERMNALAMSAEEVLARLTAIARSDMADVQDLRTATENGTSFLIKSYSLSAMGGERLEMYSALDALQLIGKHHRLFADRHEHTGKDGKPIEVDVQNAKAQLADKLANLSARREGE